MNWDAYSWLTKYVVGAKANPPKNPRRPSKNGKVIAMNIVNAEKKNEKEDTLIWMHITKWNP